MEPYFFNRIKNLIRIFFLLIFLGTSQGFIERDTYSFRLLIFEGSDWCPNCRRLEKNILSDSLFQYKLESASIHIERFDFPQRKKLPQAMIQVNQKTAEDFSFDGQFPSLIISRADTLLFKKIQYTNQSADELAQQIIQVSELLR